MGLLRIIYLKAKEDYSSDAATGCLDPIISYPIY